MPKFALVNTPTFNSTTPDKGNILLVPDVKLLSAFVYGDLNSLDPSKYNTGFSKKMIIDNFLKSVSQCKDIDQLKILTNTYKIKTNKKIEDYFIDGKFNISSEDISLSSELNTQGVMALEKSVIQSIFESQKPYMEIIQLFTSNMVLIEDIIANVLCVSGSSLNPKRNPKALGYKKNSDELKKALGGLNKLRTLNPEMSKNIENINNISDTDIENSKIVETTTEYSTGEFIEGVNYDYTYNYINEFVFNNDDELNIDEDIDEDEKPETIVFGMYDSSGNIVDDISVPYWLKESGKWYGQFDTLKSFNYIWVRKSGNRIIDRKVQYSIPDEGKSWERLKYDKGVSIGGTFFKRGDYIVVFDNNSQDVLDYLDSYLYKIEEKSIKKDISKVLLDGDNNSDDPNNQSVIQTHLQNILKYNFISTYEGPKNPIVKVPLKVKKINYNGKDVYIDPESEYDLKIIKIDTYKDIKYYDVVSESVVVDRFSRFDDAYLSIILFTNDHYQAFKYNSNDIKYYNGLDRNKKFSAKLYINNTLYNVYENVPEIKLFKEFNTSDTYQLEIYYNKDKRGKNVKYYKKIDLGNIISGNDKKVEVRIAQNILGNGRRIGDYLYVANKNSIMVTNKIVVIDNYGKEKFIDPSKVLNDHLKIDKPYSNGEYGSDENPTIEQLYRYKTSSIDSGSIYLIEGILSSKNNGINSPDKESVSFGGGSSKNYKKPWHVFKVIPKFVRLLTRLFSKLIPSITKLIRILSNPIEFSTFIFDILISKLGDKNGTEDIKFDIFSKRFVDEFNKLKDMKPLEKNTFISNSQLLKNYITIDNNKELFIFDGFTTLSFLKINLSILLNGFNFDKRLFNNYNVDLFTDNYKNDNNIVNDLSLNKYDLKNKLTNKINLDRVVTIEYSTGEFIEGIDYEFTYINEFISILLSEVDSLSNSGKLEESLYLLNIIKSLDPNNEIVDDKIKDLSDGKYGYNSKIQNPIMSTLLNLFTFPLKIVKDIIEDLLKLLKKITNPFSLPGLISEIVSFKWIINKFSNESILKYIGIKFDMSLLSSWNLEKVKIQNVDISSLLNTKKYDLSKVLDLSFTPKLPKYDFEQFKDLKSNIHTNNLKSILKMVDSISNSFIDFIWALLGLSAIVPKTKINNSSIVVSNMNSEIIKSILDNVIIDPNQRELLNNTSLIYDIKIGDRNIMDLDYNELEQWLSENKDKFDILFNF